MSSSARKSIIITGGASGIGLAITRHFALQHHDIAVLDINSTTGPSIIASVQTEHPQSTLTFKPCNVASWEEQARVFKEVYEQHGRRMDIVMANAGVSDRGENNITVLEGEDEEGPSQPNLVTVNVNFVGCLYTVKLAAYYMNKNPVSDGSSRGLIICTASNAGLYPFPISPVYAGTKAGIIGLVRSLEKPYAKHNIQINALAPAVLETNIAPDAALFRGMILTPFSTLTRGVQQFVNDSTLSGAIAEIHGDHVTLRGPPEVVDEDSAKNLEHFWSFGSA